MFSGWEYRPLAGDFYFTCQYLVMKILEEERESESKKVNDVTFREQCVFFLKDLNLDLK